MAACSVPVCSPLQQIGVKSGCVERHGVKQSAGICEARFWGSSRTVHWRAMSSKSGSEAEGRQVSVRAQAREGSFQMANAAEEQKEAADMVLEFYAAINRREIASIGDLFADKCVYEDLVFPKPFVGRKAILEFFQKFMDSVGSELEFRVDDITTGDPNAAGAIWHLDWNGKPLPFSKGCSFYRCEVLNGKRQIVYGRDAVEPATKPGDLTLVALKGLAALLRTFPSLANRFEDLT